MVDDEESVMGIGMVLWQSLNSHRGKYYQPLVKSSRLVDSLVSFPLFNTDPFDTTAAATKYDVATNAAGQIWRRALSFAASGDSDSAERLKQQAIRSSSEQVINALGYQFLDSGYISLAIDVFTRNADAHPTSWKAFSSLAEAQGYRGDTLSAIANYNTAIRLTSDSATQLSIRKKIAALLG